MKEIGTIQIQQRDTGNSRSNKRLRRDGFMPGTIYSKDMDSVAITIKKDEFKKTISQYGKNSGYKLKQPDGKIYTVIIKSIQLIPLNNEYIHAEFHKISFADKISIDVPILLTGRELLDSKDIFMVKQTEHISVTGLPQNIPENIEVDVSDKQIGDSILLMDITLPDGLVTDADPNLKIVSFTRSKKHDTEEKADAVSQTDEVSKTDEENNNSAE